MENYKLIIFDIDGTLADRSSSTLYPRALEWMKSNQIPFALATNQGGVACCEAGWGDKYPTGEDVHSRIKTLVEQMPVPPSSIHVSFFFNQKAGTHGSGVEWQETHRKPNKGMLVDAVRLSRVTTAQALMVGDREEDRLAAYNADIDFMLASDFFGES